MRCRVGVVDGADDLSRRGSHAEYPVVGIQDGEVGEHRIWVCKFVVLFPEQPLAIADDSTSDVPELSPDAPVVASPSPAGSSAAHATAAAQRGTVVNRVAGFICMGSSGRRSLATPPPW